MSVEFLKSLWVEKKNKVKGMRGEGREDDTYRLMVPRSAS
jgi:hypothetical protein